MTQSITIGILALQGAFLEHQSVLQKLKIPCKLVKTAKDLEGIDGLIIPGGESTSMGIIAEANGILPFLKKFLQEKPIWGTCAGMILLANRVLQQKQGGQILLGGMDVTVNRNYFGTQVDSFETFIDISVLYEGEQAENKKPFHAIFIRAPVITEVGPNVEVLAQISPKEIIAAKQNHLLATAFHPELSDDPRWHLYFAKLVKSFKASKSSDSS